MGCVSRPSCEDTKNSVASSRPMRRRQDKETLICPPVSSQPPFHNSTSVGKLDQRRRTKNLWSPVTSSSLGTGTPSPEVQIQTPSLRSTHITSTTAREVSESRSLNIGLSEMRSMFTASMHVRRKVTVQAPAAQLTEPPWPTATMNAGPTSV